MAADEELAGDELERMLERYARVRLDASRASARRARSAVMEDAWRRHLAAGGAAGRAGTRTRRRPFEGWGIRRLGGTLVAAVLAGVLVGSSVFAASRAGGPLYGVRLALDEITLPADAEARLETELALAQARLAEAVDASARGDQGALDASLQAYGKAITGLGNEHGTGAERALEAIRVHRVVLVAVLDGAPAAAIAGLGQAIAQSDALIARLDDAMTPGGDPGASGDGGPGTVKPGSAATPRPGATPRPTREPKAEATPKPERTPKAEATPKPERTQKPRPTPDPPGADDGDDQ